jgi:hypothetical protein
MFCPKCGIETVESHKFCKSCGANLQLVSDALKSGDDTLGQLRTDFDALKRSLGEVAKKIKVDLGLGPYAGTKQQAGDDSCAVFGIDVGKKNRSTHPLARSEARHDRAIKPKEWLQYSWQHNVRDGLISLFGGVGLGIFLYYMGAEVIRSGVLDQVEVLSRARGIESIIRLVWLVALIPVLKGFAHLAYAAFFSESIATLTERFMPALMPPSQTYDASVNPTNTARVPIQNYPSVAPASVTEQTTNILEKDETIAEAT